eukprot:scaffold2848_cov352-Pavlova_lutheri.AAC.38
MGLNRTSVGALLLRTCAARAARAALAGASTGDGKGGRRVPGEPQGRDTRSGAAMAAWERVQGSCRSHGTGSGSLGTAAHARGLRWTCASKHAQGMEVHASEGEGRSPRTPAPTAARGRRQAGSKSTRLADAPSQEPRTRQKCTRKNAEDSEEIRRARSQSGTRMAPGTERSGRTRCGCYEGAEEAARPQASRHQARGREHAVLEDLPRTSQRSVLRTLRLQKPIRDHGSR